MMLVDRVIFTSINDTFVETGKKRKKKEKKRKEKSDKWTETNLHALSTE